MIKNLVQSTLASPHTSLAAFVLFAGAAAGYLWPQYAEKIDHITQLAMVYGLLKAGDSKPTPAPTTPPTP
jgi:hypothetical protein